jgi:MFS family permease
MNRLTRTLAQRSVTRLIQVACILALLGLALLSWSILDPTPLPVIAAMSVGQGLGVAAFLCFLAAVLVDLVRSTPVQTKDGLEPPPEGPFSVRPEHEDE